MKQFAALGLAVILAATLTGCASVKMVDAAPNEARKGYVEFSMTPSSTTIWLNIWIVENGNMRQLGGIRKGWQNPHLPLTLRVAASPGVHTFAVDTSPIAAPKQIVQTFEVTVSENMLTPVQITVLELSRRKVALGTEITYSYISRVLKAVPLEGN